MPIDTKHPSWTANIDEWQKIEDITRRKNLHDYLIYLNPQDKTDENRIRNLQYRRRAVFSGIAGQTVKGMVGTMFRKWPQFSVPAGLEYLADNADGAGVSIYQQSQAVADDVIRFARSGIGVSFPPVDGQVSRADMLSGRVVATIHRFTPQQIINWRTERDGSRVRLSLVVIAETDERVLDDGYTIEAIDVIREMRLEEGVYMERQWQKGQAGWTVTAEWIPSDASGNPWDLIPFTFIGSEANDPEPDDPVMSGMVDLNIGHYRNSADWEDSVWYSGQPQPWMSGVTTAHHEWMKERNLYVGSRTPIMLPEGGQFGFASPAPNPIVRQAMIDKLDMMIGMGARMIQPGTSAKTAAQVAGEREAQHSTLSLIASNISEAYTMALEWVGRYMGVEDPDMAYTLNQEYVDPEATPQELQQIILGYLQGTIPQSDYVRYMQQRGLFDQEKTTEEYAELLPLPMGSMSTGGQGDDAEPPTD